MASWALRNGNLCLDPMKTGRRDGRRPFMANPKGAKRFLQGRNLKTRCIAPARSPVCPWRGRRGGQAAASSPRSLCVRSQKQSKPCTRALLCADMFPGSIYATRRAHRIQCTYNLPPSCRIPETPSEVPGRRLPNRANTGLREHPWAEEKTQNVPEQTLA